MTARQVPTAGAPPGDDPRNVCPAVTGSDGVRSGPFEAPRTAIRADDDGPVPQDRPAVTAEADFDEVVRRAAPIPPGRLAALKRDPHQFRRRRVEPFARLRRTVSDPPLTVKARHRAPGAVRWNRRFRWLTNGRHRRRT